MTFLYAQLALLSSKIQYVRKKTEQYMNPLTTKDIQIILDQVMHVHSRSTSKWRWFFTLILLKQKLFNQLQILDLDDLAFLIPPCSNSFSRSPVFKAPRCVLPSPQYPKPMVPRTPRSGLDSKNGGVASSPHRWFGVKQIDQQKICVQATWNQDLVGWCLYPQDDVTHSKMDWWLYTILPNDQKTCTD